MHRTESVGFRERCLTPVNSIQCHQNPATRSQRQRYKALSSLHAPGALCRPRGLHIRAVASQEGEGPEALGDEEELLPEEDWTVPGGYQDSLSSNTKLGRALDEAVSELDVLNDLEKESLVKANELLRKLGYKGDITAPEIPPKFNKEDLTR